MMSVIAADLPSTALLKKYASPSGYADCYRVEVPGVVSHAQFVGAFYTTPLFRLERAILKWLASRPSTDDEARALAAGVGDTFAAWRVEARSENQVLLADFTGRTRSWLMVSAQQGSPEPRTVLYFGSAIVPRINRGTGEKSMGSAFGALLGFHRLYSRLLLRAASRRVLKSLSQ